MSRQRKSKRRSKRAGTGGLQRLLIFLGLVLLTVAVWIGLGFLPIVSRALVLGLQIGAAVLILGTGSLFLFLNWRRRRKAAAAIEEEILLDPGADEAEEVSARMRQALDKLKKSQGLASLYDLPWYVIIGPPGAGKTTALRNSGIEFVGASDDEAVRGFGGTRNCDWWFGEEAILIDTAGRYTSQDSDTEVDRAGWRAFLQKLKQTRPKQPINGVILAMSIDTIMSADEHGIAAHADTIRRRLSEIRETLKIDFPVYVLFTKADKIYGFREFVSRFREGRRRSVWGTTFQSTARSPEMHKTADQEFDALVERLSSEIVDRLDEEADLSARIAIFSLAGQMAGMKTQILEFLRRVFKESQHSQNAILRGFYFASGTQEGTAIDQVLGEMATAGSSHLRIEAGRSGRGASFFLHDLLRDVIFAERDWVSYDQRAIRWSTGLRAVGLSLVIVVGLTSLAYVAWTSWNTRSMFSASDARAGEYLDDGFQAALEQPVTDPSLDQILNRLDLLRGLPLGTDPRVAETGRWWRGFVLFDPREQVRSSSGNAYAEALEVLLRPRLMMLVERDLYDAMQRQDTSDVYSALKTYILLDPDEAPTEDDAHLLGWFTTYLQRNRELSDLRVGQDTSPADRLLVHFQALLQGSGEGLEGQDYVDARPEVIRVARAFFGTRSLTEIAFAVIQSRADTFSADPEFELRDFVLSSEVDLEAAERVFRTRSGAPLSDVRVDWLYTVEGFTRFFIAMIDVTKTSLREDSWVLGESRSLETLNAEINRLDETLYPEYRRNFSAAWAEALGDLEMNTLRNPPNYVALQAAGSLTQSPIRDLVRAVTEHTRLSPEDSAEADGDGEGGALGAAQQALNSSPLGGVAGAFARFGAREFVLGTSGTPRRILDEIGRGSGGRVTRGTSPAEQDVSPSARTILEIETDFEDWHRLWISPDNAEPRINAVLSILTAIRLELALSSDADISELLFDFADFIRVLPEPLQGMMIEAEREFREGVRNELIARMNRALTSDVYSFCSRTTNSFPFVRTSAGISMADFSSLFGQNGRFNTYFRTYLADHVILEADGYVPDPRSAISAELSRGTLDAFTRALRITEAFFGNSDTPRVPLNIQRVRASDRIENLTLYMEGGNHDLNSTRPVVIDWVGAVDVTTLSANVRRGVGATPASVPSPPSQWSVMRFINAARSRSVSGNSLTLTYDLGGEEVVIRLTTGGRNPFNLRELDRFPCPLSVD